MLNGLETSGRCVSFALRSTRVAFMPSKQFKHRQEEGAVKTPPPLLLVLLFLLIRL